jgi:CMP-N-acetylneuraminic acid synthetase
MNVDKVLERDQKLSQLDDRAGKIYIFKEKMFDSKKRVFLFI